MSEEFRRSVRREPDRKVEVLDMMTHEPMGTVANISETGIMLFVHVPLEVDAIYQCEIRFPPEYGLKAPFIVGMQEMWSEPASAGGVTCAGFRVIDIARTDRLQLNDWVNGASRG